MTRTEALELVYFRGCPSVEAARAVRGRDVLGDGPIAAARACRAGDLPTPDLIVTALERKRG